MLADAKNDGRRHAARHLSACAAAFAEAKTAFANAENDVRWRVA
jgi:hypothetical protein